MDNLLTGHRENVAHHQCNGRFSFVEHDVTEYIEVDGPLDFILHLASPASPADFEALGLARAKGAKFLLASTSEVYGDGTQTRSIGHVSDLVAGISKLMESAVMTPVNIGNPVELTMAQLAAKIIDLTGSSSTITHRPLPADDPKIRLPDISKARQMLGWEPSIGPDEGLARTIEWFRSSEE